MSNGRRVACSVFRAGALRVDECERRRAELCTRLRELVCLCERFSLFMTKMRMPARLLVGAGDASTNRMPILFVVPSCHARF